MPQQLDSSLCSHTEAQYDAYWSTRHCAKCEREMSDEDIEIDREIGDGFCDECRSLEEGVEL
jgi:hypothetical protein